MQPILSRLLIKGNGFNNYKLTLNPYHPHRHLAVCEHKTKAVKCWKCGIEKRCISELFCEKCNIIQTPQDKNNYFKVFKLAEDFLVDQKELTKKYHQLQSVLHPDKFSKKSIEEKVISEDCSSLVNEAYDILQSPLKRAVHLLSLKGVQIEEQKIENPNFLMEIMELNEEVESATTEELKKTDLKNKLALDKITNDIHTCFISNDLEGAKTNIIKMKYYASIAAHINHLLREKGIVD